MEPQQIAEVCHEANRILQKLLQEIPNPPWNHESGVLRDSVIDGVRNILENDLTPEESHESWLAYKENEGWTYGPHKDFEAKTHPCMVSYDQLPPEQKLKDRLFVNIVKAFG